MCFSSDCATLNLPDWCKGKALQDRVSRKPLITHKCFPLQHLKSSIHINNKVCYTRDTILHVTRLKSLVSMIIPSAGNSPGNSGGIFEAIVETR